MTEERRVDMVRIVGEERVYDREELLGRDAASVFPSLARQQEAAEAGVGGLSVDAIKEALGARKFISESELETIRATRGVTADDGAVAADKPLAEILRERKAAKEAEHAEKWRLMKVGKNRPLDPEELQFLDSVAAAEAERERAWSLMERSELEAFKAAVRERSAEPEGPPRPAGGSATAAARTDPRVPSVAASKPAFEPKPVLKAVVKVKPKAAPNSAAAGSSGAAAASTSGPASTGAAAGPAGASPYEPPSKRVKTGEDVETDDKGAVTAARPSEAAGQGGAGGAATPEGGGGGLGGKGGGGGGKGGGEQGEGQEGGGGGLCGLIGDYGSDSD